MSVGLPEPVDWKTFWETDHNSEDWHIEPILPKGRQVALYAPAKVGKSLLSLDLAARKATGTPIFGAVSPRCHIIYLDMEMTENDLAERLEDMGYGPETDFSYLHYYLLPSLPSLDTRAGGDALMELVKRHGAELVIIDTTSRVIEGPENEADTIRSLYQHTGSRLKASGVTVLRLDHAGKKLENGQRGTSAKNDDLDLVWELSGSETAFTLRATHRRQSWIPENINLTRVDDPFRHEIVEEFNSTATVILVRIMEELEIPEDWGARRVRKAFRDAGKQARNEQLAAAIRYRKMHPKDSGTRAGTHAQAELGIPVGDTL